MGREVLKPVEIGWQLVVFFQVTFNNVAEKPCSPDTLRLLTMLSTVHLASPVSGSSGREVLRFSPADGTQFSFVAKSLKMTNMLPRYTAFDCDFRQVEHREGNKNLQQVPLQTLGSVAYQYVLGLITSAPKKTL